MAISFLQTWYQQQCNGFWEHSYGVTIETLDSPGWVVTIDLMETPLERERMEPVRQERSAKDWLVCEVTQKQFRGQGDSQKLLGILTVFETWASLPRPAAKP
jgi:hypothetical protein